MKGPTDDDLLPEHTDTDAYLATIRRELIEQLAAGLDLNAGLSAILGTRDRQVGFSEQTAATNADNSPSAMSVTPSSASSTADCVVVVITTRMRGRDLDRTVGLASAFANVFANNLARGQRRHHALEVLRELARDLDSALEIIHEIISEPDRFPIIDRIGVLESGAAVTRHLADNLGCLRDLGRERELGRDVDPDLAREFDRGVEATHNQVRELLRRLNQMEIDASGADLSLLGLSDMDVLEGVVWTDETVWPPGVYDQVRALSSEIRPGVYQVSRRGKEVRADLVTA